MSDDRPTAILTKSQREYLNDEREPTQERTMRTRIRNRLRAGLFDLSLIFQKFPLEDIDSATKDPDDTITLPVTNTLPNVAGLLYLMSSDLEKGDLDEHEIDWMTEVGVQRALNRLGVAWESVSNEVTIERGEELTELAGEDLTELPRRQLRQLHFTGLITDEQFSEAVMESSDGE